MSSQLIPGRWIITGERDGEQIWLGMTPVIDGGFGQQPDWVELDSHTHESGDVFHAQRFTASVWCYNHFVMQTFSRTWITCGLCSGAGGHIEQNVEMLTDHLCQKCNGDGHYWEAS